MKKNIEIYEFFNKFCDLETNLSKVSDELSVELTQLKDSRFLDIIDYELKIDSNVIEFNCLILPISKKWLEIKEFGWPDETEEIEFYKSVQTIFEKVKALEK